MEFKPNTEDVIQAADAETLSGDIRDALLIHVRTMRVPWAMLAEDEQQDIIDAITKTAESAVRQAATLIAQRGFPALAAQLGKWTVKDGIKLEVTLSGTVDNITSLAEHAGGATLVLAEIGSYIGERAAAKPDKRQGDLLDDAA